MQTIVFTMCCALSLHKVEVPKAKPTPTRSMHTAVQAAFANVAKAPPVKQEYDQARAIRRVLGTATPPPKDEALSPVSSPQYDFTDEVPEESMAMPVDATGTGAGSSVDVPPHESWDFSAVPMDQCKLEPSPR